VTASKNSFCILSLNPDIYVPPLPPFLIFLCRSTFSKPKLLYPFWDLRENFFLKEESENDKRRGLRRNTETLRYSVTRNVYQLRPSVFSLGLNNQPCKYFIL
jgi:hypothetical protein